MIESNTDQDRSIMLSRSSSGSSTSQINSNLTGLQLSFDGDDFISNEVIDEQIEDNPNAILYEINEVYDVISQAFEEARSSEEPVECTFEIELDAELMEIASAVEQFSDVKMIKDKFRELSRFLIWPIESGSGYYWEIRKIHLRTKHKQLTHSAIMYLGCTMREDRAWQRPEDQTVIRRSETRAAIKRYNCAGSIKLSIDVANRRAVVNIYHRLQHEHPTYRQILFPDEAKEWIRTNIHNTEVYRRLCNEKLINPELHTKEQVYYWISSYKRSTYIMNQLISAKLYLEQPEFSAKGFKMLAYIENEFVRALGFCDAIVWKYWC